jgi:hypothetical protein
LLLLLVAAIDLDELSGISGMIVVVK